MRDAVRRGFVDVEGLQIHYREAGSGPAVLLSGQCPGSSLQWVTMLEQLADRGYRAIAADMPGLGDSEAFPDAPAIQDYARVLAGVVDALGLETVDGVGHHTGAAVLLAASVATPNRFRKLVYAGLPVYQTWEGRYGILANCAIETYDTEGTYVANRVRLSSSYLSPSIDRPYFASRILIERLQAGPYWFRPYVAVGTWTGGMDALRASKHPTLIIAIGNDGLANLAGWQAEALPDARIADLPEGGVYPHINTAPAFADLIDGFLRADA